MDFKAGKCVVQFFLICVSIQACAAKASLNDVTSDKKKTTKVFSPGHNIVNSDPSKAVLTHDPIGSLPNSFTICSTVMAPFIFQNDLIMFLTMLDKNGNDLFWPVINILMTNEEINTAFNWERNWKELEKDGKELHAFSNQWIKGCFAVNRSSGLYQAVVDGVFVANGTMSESFLIIQASIFASNITAETKILYCKTKGRKVINKRE